MDFGKLAYIKAKEFESAKESGGVGYVDHVRSISWNGDLTGRAVIDNGDGTFLVRISETVVDLREFTTVYRSALNSSGEFVGQIKVDSFTVIGDVLTEQGIIDPAGNMLVGIISDAASAAGAGEVGIYASYIPLSEKSASFISCIESSAIHPIDPKFLPSVRFDLAKLGIGSLLSIESTVMETYTLTEEVFNEFVAACQSEQGVFYENSVLPFDYIPTSRCAMDGYTGMCSFFVQNQNMTPLFVSIGAVNEGGEISLTFAAKTL